MKKNKLLFGLILSLLFNVGFISSLGYHLWKRREIQKTFKDQVAQQKHFIPKKMRFTHEQRMHLRKIRRTFLYRIWPLRKKLAEEREALGKLLMNDKPDTILIEKKLHEIGELQTKMEKEVVFQILREKDVLTPQQREQFFRVVEKRLNIKPSSPRGRLDRRKHPRRMIRDFEKP